MDRQRATGTAAPGDSLAAVLTEAERELASAEARLCSLLDRAVALASGAELERGRLQGFLDAFALERAIDDQAPGPGSEGTSSPIDVRALRHGAQELAEELNRSSALRGQLATAVQVARSLKEQFAADRAFQPAQRTSDIGVQQAMNAAREDERRRLAREVHDGPAQVLVNAIFAIDIAEQVARRKPDQVAEELARVRALLKDGVAEVRRFMFGLRPTMLEDQGLVPTLRRVVDDFSRFFEMRVTLEIEEPLPALGQDEDLTIFRIVQEALQNVRKHAQAPSARIALACRGRQLELTVEDTGKGFDPATIVAHSGMGAGLPGMRERAKLIGAELAVESTPGAGTTLRLALPLRTPANRLPAASARTA